MQRWQRGEAPLGSNNPQIEEGYGDIADGFILGRNKYSSRRYQTSKKVKK
jgi:hypothetical protein